jgi:hypothetical protein
MEAGPLRNSDMNSVVSVSVNQFRDLFPEEIWMPLVRLQHLWNSKLVSTGRVANVDGTQRCIIVT